MSPLVTVTHSTAVPENYPPHGHIVREFKSKLENLESQNQVTDVYLLRQEDD